MSQPALEAPPWHVLPRVRRAIMVVDVVESVRVMLLGEDDFVNRWRRFVKEVQLLVLPAHGGRLVKSLGDGMLLEFIQVNAAVAAGLDIQRRMGLCNESLADHSALYLRLGVHVADVLVDDLDVYGAGVNLAARLAGLAGPGEVILSAAARDEIVPGVDAEVEDLGDCHLKHIDQPQRAFRITNGSVVDGVRPKATPARDLQGPVVAVIPMLARTGDVEAAICGEFVADAVISQLSANAGLRVISRLSTSALKLHNQLGEAARRHLNATFVLTGTCAVVAERLILTVELSDLRTDFVIWANRLVVDKGELFSAGGGFTQDIANAANLAIVQAETTRARTLPFESLECFSLLIGSIALLHRASLPDFQRARQALEALIERAPRHASAHAWKAKWHFLNVIRGQSHSADDDRSRARQESQRAVECDENSSVAHTYRGLVKGFLDQDLDQADACYTSALALNPNEAMAWLFTGTLRSWQGRGAEAAVAAQRALDLSPLDPMHYYYDSLAAAAMLADRQYLQAISLSRRSLRANRVHTATYRVLAIAQVMSGETAAASETVRQLMALEPNFTVTAYSARYPGRDTAHAADYAHALRDAGVPQA